MVPTIREGMRNVEGVAQRRMRLQGIFACLLCNKYEENETDIPNTHLGEAASTRSPKQHPPYESESTSGWVDAPR